MIPAKHFYMIRHGETVANAAQIMAGSTDSPLTSLGRKQAEKVIAIMDYLPKKPEIIVHSHLSRARDTAAIINTRLNLPMIEEPGVAELHAGEWEGVPYAQCAALLTDWPDPPGGETFADFSSRIRVAKNKILKRTESSPLIVSHGGVFRALGMIFGIKIPGVPNCRLFEFEPKLERHDTARGASRVFPWQVWCYENTEKVIRRPVDIFDQPADEIA